MNADKVIIIAEAGVNHNGDLDMARRMVAEARKAGADYVKFQTAVPELVISTYAPKAEYQKETTGSGQSQLEMCKAIHLPLSDYAGLAELCRREGIGFMSTPFDLTSIDCLAEIGMDYWKIPSGEITNLPYLRKIGALGAKIIMSTGMASLAEVEDAVNILEKAGTPRSRIWLLHCTTQYPAPSSCPTKMPPPLLIPLQRQQIRSRTTDATELAAAASVPICPMNAVYEVNPTPQARLAPNSGNTHFQKSDARSGLRFTNRPH